MGESWTVNSDSSCEAYIANVRKDYKENKYVTYGKPRYGKDRSLDQNALFHVFCTEWIAHKLCKHYKAVDKADLAGMKRTVKKMYYLAHPDADWMIHVITDYTTAETRKDYTSSGDWKVGEMFSVLEFMQNTAANDGIVLESKGQFAKLQREQKI